MNLDSTHSNDGLTQLNIKLGEVLNRLDAVERENHLLRAKLMELEREVRFAA